MMNAEDQRESDEAKVMMEQNRASKGPVIVTQNGQLLYNTDELGVTGMRSFDFLSENTCSRLPDDDEGDDEDAFAEEVVTEYTSGSTGNSTPFNEYKAFSTELAKLTEADPDMRCFIMEEYAQLEAVCRYEFHRRHPVCVPPGAASTTLNPVRIYISLL